MTARDGRVSNANVGGGFRSEEHTSELQSHSFISYAVFCLKKKIMGAGGIGPPQGTLVRCGAAACDGAVARQPRNGTRIGRASEAPSEDDLDPFFFLIIGQPRSFTLFPHPALFR